MSKKKIIQKIVLGGVVVRNKHILILQRSGDEDIYPNMWELPSGKREPLENSEECLVREIEEETGLDVEVILPFAVFEYQIEREDEIIDSTQINFIVKPKGNFQVKLSLEHQNFVWITENEIDNFDLTDSTKKVIKAAFESSFLK